MTWFDAIPDDVKSTISNTVRNLMYIIIGGIIVATWMQSEQAESNVERMSADSKQAVVINQETKEHIEEAKNELKEFEKPIVDSNGYMSDEFMQLLQSSISTAERRGNKGGIIHTLTKP